MFGCETGDELEVIQWFLNEFYEDLQSPALQPLVPREDGAQGEPVEAEQGPDGEEGAPASSSKVLKPEDLHPQVAIGVGKLKEHPKCQWACWISSRMAFRVRKAIPKSVPKDFVVKGLKRKLAVFQQASDMEAPDRDLKKQNLEKAYQQAPATALEYLANSPAKASDGEALD